MENRKLPFGYEMRFGKIVAAPDEAALVQKIFQRYTSGASYQQLVTWLAAQGVPYRAETPWSKNMVARVLHDTRYAGEAPYPTLLEEEVLRMAASLAKARAAPPRKSEAVSAIQQLAVCALCGERLTRHPNQHGRERWQCPSCKSLTTAVTDQRLEQSVTVLLKRCVDTPMLVRQPEEPSQPPSNALTDAQQALDQEFNAPEYSEDNAKRLAFALAAAQFSAIGSEDYETERIRRLLEAVPPEADFNSELLRDMTEAVLVSPCGGVRLRLKNHQIIEGSPTNE